jgi:hypothetical protein
MRITLAIIALVFAASFGNGAVNVSFSSSDSLLQQEFISNTTNQYKATLTASPYFANTFSIVISSRTPSSQAPQIEDSVIDQCMAYGMGDGMDYERYENIRLIKHAREYWRVFDSTGCVDSCYAMIDGIIKTLSDRWGYIYDPSGVKVSP